jgi:hypothetical protein
MQVVRHFLAITVHIYSVAQFWIRSNLYQNFLTVARLPLAGLELW